MEYAARRSYVRYLIHTFRENAPADMTSVGLAQARPNTTVESGVVIMKTQHRLLKKEVMTIVQGRISYVHYDLPYTAPHWLLNIILSI